MTTKVESSRIKDILADPRKGITLEELKEELNDLAKFRNNTRLAFCKRLAVAYLLHAGRGFTKEAPRDGATAKFIKWCNTNLRSGTGKAYSSGSIYSYLRIGFSGDPAKALSNLYELGKKRRDTVHKLGVAVEEAVRREKAKVVPITVLRDKHRLATDVAKEVNVMMRSWEQCSPEARSQFVHFITGRRVHIA